MGRGIVKIKDMVVEWSTVVDAPVSYGMTLEDMRDYTRHEYGNRGMEDWAERVKRIEETGTSFIGREAKDFWNSNRAGPDEAPLSEDELYEAYCMRQPIRNGWKA